MCYDFLSIVFMLVQVQGNPCHNSNQRSFPWAAPINDFVKVHCFFEPGNYEQTEAIRYKDDNKYYFDKDIGEAVCFRYKSRLPHLPSKWLLEQFQILAMSKLGFKNKHVPLGLKIKNIDVYDLDLVWDNGWEEKQHVGNMYGKEDAWTTDRQALAKNRYVFMETLSGMLWTTPEHLGIKEYGTATPMVLVCHYIPGDEPTSAPITTPAKTTTRPKGPAKASDPDERKPVTDKSGNTIQTDETEETDGNVNNADHPYPTIGIMVVMVAGISAMAWM